MFMVFAAAAFTSCGDDDDDAAVSGASSALVGNWHCADDNMLYVLKSNGRYAAYEYPNLTNGTYEDYWDGKWTYDETTKDLLFYYGNTSDIEDEYKVVSVTENTFTTDGGDVWTRVADKDIPTKQVD